MLFCYAKGQVIKYHTEKETRFMAFDYTENTSCGASSIVNISMKRLNIYGTIPTGFEFFSFFAGNSFMYSGDVVGGILCILSDYRNPCVKERIRFLNQPKERDFVYFYSSGSKVITEDSVFCNDDSYKVNGQAIILNFLKKEYKVQIEVSSDSINYLYLNIIDDALLHKHFSPIEQLQTEEDMQKTRSDSTNVFYINFRLKMFAHYIAMKANVLLEENPDMTNDYLENYNFYNFDFPLDMFDAPLIWSKFDEINQFLATKGLRLERRRKLEKVYNIRFLDGH